MSDTPIEAYAFLSDCRTAALVDRDGSVDWLCMPRFDADAQFARLLDAEGGHWSLRPSDASRTERRYLEGTLVLETVHRTGAGAVLVEDLLVTGPNRDGHALGAEAPHALLRRVRGLEGRVEMETVFAPRPEYGLVHPLLRRAEGGLLGQGGASVLRLCSEVPLEIEEATARGRFTVERGELRSFALLYRDSSSSPPPVWGSGEIERRRDETVEAWRRWSRLHQRYEGPWKEEVDLAGRVLGGLTYHPTGAIVAAATTSLPERVGGVRNWDYRFTWVRDASFTLEALWVAACPDEAHRFFDFLAAAALSQVRRGGELQIMFGVGGEHDLSERELFHLAGWRGSRPVRVGNGAWDQRQLDVYGELLGAAWRLREYLSESDGATREFLARVADAAATRWREKDRGIWEVRGPSRHFLYSKLMCWVALDRAFRMRELLGASGDRARRWGASRDGIRRAILKDGWNEEVGAFTQTFGGEALDASGLVMGLVGFLSPDDPRVRATVEATVRELTGRDGLVYRYRSDDGLEGEEGLFLLCTFWLAEAWARGGEPARARELVDRVLTFGSDLGLLAEEVDPEGGGLLGNYPQAYSHIGLVNAARAVALAERGAEEDSGDGGGGRFGDRAGDPSGLGGPSGEAGIRGGDDA